LSCYFIVFLKGDKQSLQHELDNLANSCEGQNITSWHKREVIARKRLVEEDSEDSDQSQSIAVCDYVRLLRQNIFLSVFRIIPHF